MDPSIVQSVLLCMPRLHEFTWRTQGTQLFLDVDRWVLAYGIHSFDRLLLESFPSNNLKSFLKTMGV